MTSGEKLCDKSLTTIKFPYQELVRVVENGFQAFLRESREYKDQYTFYLEGDTEPDDGYFSRNGESDGKRSHDVKEVFHFRPSLLGFLKDRGVDYGRHKAWLDSCSELFDLCREESLELSKGMSSSIEGGGFCFKEAMLDAEKNPLPYSRSVLRFLSYPSGGNKGLVASEHTDRSFISLRLFGSDPASFLVDGESLPPVDDDCAHAFLGKKAEMLSGGYLHALWHGVKPSARGGSSPEHHSSIVYFAHTGPSLQHGDHK